MADPFPVLPGRTALLVVDMQRYFTEPGHAFSRLSGRRIEDGIEAYFQRIDSKVIPNIRSLLEAFRQRAWPIFYTRLGCYASDGSDLPAWARHINESSLRAFGSMVFPPFQDRSAEIDPRVAPEAADRILRKTTTGAVASSPLESDLRALKVASVVVTGVLTPFCVTQTARELADRDFDVAIVEDAAASLTDAAHAAALSAFAAIYGWVLNRADVLMRLHRG